MTVDELRSHLTLSVPAAGAILGLGVSAAYGAARRGEIPTLRLGRKLIVPTAKLLVLLGVGSPDNAGTPASGGTASAEAAAQPRPAAGGASR